MPMYRCPRCAHRPLVGTESTCPSCALNLDQVRADAALLMQPSREWRRRVVSSIPVKLRKSSNLNIDAEPEPIEGAVRDCPACGARSRFTNDHASPSGKHAAAWVCDAGHVAIEDFRC